MLNAPSPTLPRVVRSAVLVTTPDRRPAPAPPVPARLKWKAAVDAALAAVLLVFAVPVILAAAVVIRTTSAGPALYTQTRLGRTGRPFTIYKLRTMCFDAESLTGARWSVPGDPRITPLGKFLRATHVDELPQLWNVIRGEMALVGPRPERPEIAADLRREIPGYDRRLAVKPGMTGFAQIHLPPDETVDSVRRKLAFDLFYVRRAGPGFDVWILVCTGLKVLGLRRLYARRAG